MGNHEIYRDARDRLVALHGEHEKAVADFTWPQFDGAFQWAHDWFDVIADGETRTALRIVEEDGAEGAWTFDELRRRSTRWPAGWHRTGSGAGTACWSCWATASSCGSRCSR